MNCVICKKEINNDVVKKADHLFESLDLNISEEFTQNYVHEKSECFFCETCMQKEVLTAFNLALDNIEYEDITTFPHLNILDFPVITNPIPFQLYEIYLDHVIEPDHDDYLMDLLESYEETIMDSLEIEYIDEINLTQKRQIIKLVIDEAKNVKIPNSILQTIRSQLLTQIRNADISNSDFIHNCGDLIIQYIMNKKDISILQNIIENTICLKEYLIYEINSQFQTIFKPILKEIQQILTTLKNSE